MLEIAYFCLLCDHFPLFWSFFPVLLLQTSRVRFKLIAITFLFFAKNSKFEAEHLWNKCSHDLWTTIFSLGVWVGWSYCTGNILELQLHNTVHISKGSMTPRSRTQNCYWHRGAGLRIVIDTAEWSSIHSDDRWLLLRGILW